MKTLVLTMLLLTSSSFVFAQANIEISKKEPLVIGEKVEMKSIALDEKRTLNIYLPNSYGLDSAKKYPVIYLLDGSIDEDFIHIAGLVQFGSFSWINMLPESIVVGISNVDRKRDFTCPTKDKEHIKQFPTTGHSAPFIKFIEQELQPFIERNYRTTPEKTLIGQSLGGLLATEILFTKPDMFDNYIIVSPSLWWNDEYLIKKRTKPVVYTTNKKIFVAVGKEGDIMEREAKELYERLDKVKKDNTQLYFQFFENQNHGDVLHVAVYSAFEHLFMKHEDAKK